MIRDREYAPAMNAYRDGELVRALEVFPAKEKNGFVTTVEKSWIGFWAGSTEVEPLQKQVRTFEDRKFVSVTRETETFLFAESEEGYVPDEHEVVLLHLISAMLYMKRHEWSDAEVEARRAGYYLQNYFTEDQKHFDDPALRVWLAGIWAGLGNWQEAQVDLRRAGEMTKDKSLLKLAERNDPPADFVLYFSGVGPRLKWTEGVAAPEFVEPQNLPNDYRAYPTYPWYEHHLHRNTVLRDSLVSSNYMAQYLGAKTGTVTEKAMGKTAAFSGKAAGYIAGGLVIATGIYVAIQTNSGEIGGYIAGLGVALGLWVVEKVEKWDRWYQRKLIEEELDKLEALKVYRLVRFMPDYVGFELQAPPKPVIGTRILLRAPSSRTQLQLYRGVEGFGTNRP